ncbi:MAG TPA: hypothetical protein VEB21_07735 [Terriglobales bacterium]|nr:hypothetical protein [Terriglobales bacterium]
MKGATHRWVFAGLAGLWSLAMAGVALAADVKVTDEDRVFRNFTREAAVVDRGQIRLEVRGFYASEESEDHDVTRSGRCRGPLRENCARLDLNGRRVIGVESLNGGIIDLLASYGVAPNTEIGLILPGVIETAHRDDGTTETEEDLGDLTLYGKFRFAITEMFSVAGGLELSTPTGSDDKLITVRDDPDPDIEDGTASGFGTGHFGFNPFVSFRWSWQRLALESHVGYNVYTSSDIKRVFNWSAAGIIKAGESWAFRTEFSGRIWDQFGTRWVDVVCMPGIDIELSDNFIFRPTGMANITETAMDWGIGAGIAATF